MTQTALMNVILVEDHNMLLYWSSHINPQWQLCQVKYSQNGKLEAEIGVSKRDGIASLIGWNIAHQETLLTVLLVGLHIASVKLAVLILHSFNVVFVIGNQL
jgi:hypothetical protein